MEDSRTERIKMVAVICFVLLIISLAIPGSWVSYEKKKEKKDTWVIDVSNIKHLKPAASDSNNDGGITWKEVIDQTIPMTEAQKAELRKIPIDQKAMDALNDPNNLTASFSKNLFLAAATIQENNITDQKTRQALIDQISQEEADKIQPRHYTDKDILIAKSENKDSIKAYGNTIAPILKEVITVETVTNTVTGVTENLKTNNSQQLLEINKDSKRINLLLKKLQTVSVPPSAILPHLQMLNRISEYNEVIYGLSRLDTDPMRASLVFPQYIPTANKVVDMFINYTNYFNKQNVTFANSEAGYVFVTGFRIE